MSRLPWPALICVMALLGAWPAGDLAGSIETAILEQPWPRQSTRTFEVHKYEVRWRQLVDRKNGLLIGVEFRSPADLETTWRMATEYGDVGSMTPGVTAVRYLEQTPTRQVVQVDIKVLWKQLQLTFEVEQDPPNAIRFRLADKAVGQYLGVLLLRQEGEAPAEPVTHAQLATWLKPARPVPLRLLVIAERMIFLQGVKRFLQACEREALTAQSHEANAVEQPVDP